MSDVKGLYGYNQITSDTNLLFGVYGNDIVDVENNTGYKQNVSNTEAEFATYLGYCFFVNDIDDTRSFDGSEWSDSGIVNRAPIAKYVQPYGTGLYLGYVTINSEEYPSRVWHSGLPHNNKPRWELEWGDDLSQAAGSAIVNSSVSFFSDYGVKEGDPLWILDGNNAGEYTVDTVNHNHKITLTETLKNTVASSDFIVGSNYFDVKTDDNEPIQGLAENSNRLLVFKTTTMHRYNGSSLMQVRGAPGTTSNRSIVNVRTFTCYFHGAETEKTGFYIYNGESSLKISNAVQPYIDAIPASMFDKIVAWHEGDTYRAYVGDLTNKQRGIDMDDVVLSYHVVQNKWSVDPISKVPRCSTVWIVNNREQTFFGDDNGTVFRTPIGYDYDNDPITWAMETGPVYPEGPEFNLRFTRIQIVARDAKGIKVRYKLYNKPETVDTQWQPLGDLKDDKTELQFLPEDSRSAGINIRLDETSMSENSQAIERITLFYEKEGTKFLHN